jgi:hypothetical protein
MGALASAAVVQTADTLHYWNFDDGTGKDLAGSFDVAAYEGAVITSGVAITFDNQATNTGKIIADATGYTNYSSLGNFIGADGSFTFEAMVKPLLADSSTFQEILCGEGDGGGDTRGFQFRIESDDKTLRFQNLSSGTNNWNAAISYTPGQWYHAAVTFDAATGALNMYWTPAGQAAFNVLSITVDAVNNPLLQAGDMTRFCIGNELRVNGGYGNENFEGWIDEVGIHGVALTSFDTSIPEPTTMALLGLGALGLIKRRRA